MEVNINDLHAADNKRLVWFLPTHQNSESERKRIETIVSLSKKNPFICDTPSDFFKMTLGHQTLVLFVV